MALDDAKLDLAYSIFEEWGLQRRITRADRLRTTFPLISKGELLLLLEKMEAVSKTVWKIAKLGGEKKTGKEKVVELLLAEHPFLNDKGMNRAVCLMNYYAWHEGY